MVVYCCVPGCGVTYKNGLKMHVFPKDLQRRIDWCKNIKRPDLIDLDERRRRNLFRVCDVHFRETDKFETCNNRTNLKFTALPWIKPGSSRGLEECGSSDVDLSQPGPSESKLAGKKHPTTSEPVGTVSGMGSLENFVRNGTKCIGVAANYRSLLKVLNRPEPEVPDFFIKPVSSYITKGQKIIIPKGFSVNEEIELGVVIGQQCKKAGECNAMDFVGGYCIALDMTATCKLGVARKTGGSWTLGKGFDTACPVSPFIPKAAIPDPHNVQLWCNVNGEERQTGNTNDLLFNVPFLVSYISKYITLEPNDVIITGSPPGMGPVKRGDIIEGGIKGGICIRFEVDAE